MDTYNGVSYDKGSAGLNGEIGKQFTCLCCLVLCEFLPRKNGALFMLDA